MLLIVSVGTLSCMVMNSFILFSGSSRICFEMQLKTKLFLMLHASKSRTFSFMVLFFCSNGGELGGKHADVVF